MTLLGKIDEVPPGRSRTYVTAGKRILVVNVGGEIKAFENFCPHMGGAMRYDGKRITCSWHGAQFDAKSGECRGGPALGSSLKPLVVRVEGDALYYEPTAGEKSPWADDF